MGGLEGTLHSGKKDADYNIASMADWYDTREITIGAADVVIATTYAGMKCKQIRAESAAGKINYTTERTPLVANKQQLNLDQKQVSGKLPSIHTICGTGNGSSAIVVKLYFQLM